MNSQTAIASTILTQHNLNRLPIMNRDNAEEIGRVSHLWLDLKNHRVESITCKAGLMGRKAHTFRWSQLHTIGKDSLFVSLSEIQESKRAEDTADIVGRELWTDTGNQAGVIDDYLIDPRNGNVIAYLFDTNGWLGTLDGQFQLVPGAIISIGSKRVIASISAIRDAEIWSGGLTQRAAQIKESASSLGAQLQEQGQLLGAQAKTQLSEVSKEVRTRSRKLTAEAKEQLSEVTTQLTEKGQQLDQTLNEKVAEAQGSSQQPKEPASTQTLEKSAELNLLSEPEPQQQLSTKDGTMSGS